MLEVLVDYVMGQAYGLEQGIMQDFVNSYIFHVCDIGHHICLCVYVCFCIILKYKIIQHIHGISMVIYSNN